MYELLLLLYNGTPQQLYPITKVCMLFNQYEVDQCAKIWLHITKCELKINMRIVSSSKYNKKFYIDMLQIGNGEFQAVNDFIALIIFEL